MSREVLPIDEEWTQVVTYRHGLQGTHSTSHIAHQPPALLQRQRSPHSIQLDARKPGHDQIGPVLQFAAGHHTRRRDRQSPLHSPQSGALDVEILGEVAAVQLDHILVAHSVHQVEAGRELAQPIRGQIVALAGRLDGKTEVRLRIGNPNGALMAVMAGPGPFVKAVAAIDDTAPR